MARLELHLPWDALDLRHRGAEYRGLTACGRMVKPESMGSFDGPHRVSCPDCRSHDTAPFAPRRAAALRGYLAKLRPKRPLDTAEIATLGLVPADQDVRVGGKWTTRALDELLALSEARMGKPESR